MNINLNIFMQITKNRTWQCLQQIFYTLHLKNGSRWMPDKYLNEVLISPGYPEVAAVVMMSLITRPRPSPWPSVRGTAGAGAGPSWRWRARGLGAGARCGTPRRSWRRGGSAPSAWWVVKFHRALQCQILVESATSTLKIKTLLRH